MNFMLQIPTEIGFFIAMRDTKLENVVDITHLLMFNSCDCLLFELSTLSFHLRHFQKLIDDDKYT